MSLHHWHIIDDIQYIIIGFFAGIVKVLMRDSYGLGDILASCLVSGFAAWMSKAFFCAYYPSLVKSEDALVFICGISGYLGVYILNYFSGILKRFMMRIPTDEVIDKPNKEEGNKNAS